MDTKVINDCLNLLLSILSHKILEASQKHSAQLFGCSLSTGHYGKIGMNLFLHQIIKFDADFHGCALQAELKIWSVVIKMFLSF